MTETQQDKLKLMGDAYSEEVANQENQISNIASQINDLSEQISAIEDVALPGLTSDMNDALEEKAFVYSSYLGVPVSACTSGNYGITNLEEWRLISGGCSPKSGKIILAPGTKETTPVYIQLNSPYVREITLAAATPMTDYQVQVKLDNTFTYSKLSSPSGYDIRFISENGVLLNYFTERWKYGDEARFWVKIPTKDEEKIYMLYGGTSIATSAYSSGEKTFQYFEDFDGSELPEYWSEIDRWNNDYAISGSCLTTRFGGIYADFNDLIGENFSDGNWAYGVKSLSIDPFNNGHRKGWHVGNTIQYETLNDEPALIWHAFYSAGTTYGYVANGNSSSWNIHNAVDFWGSVSVSPKVWYYASLGTRGGGNPSKSTDACNLRVRVDGALTYDGSNSNNWKKPLQYMFFAAATTDPGNQANYEDIKVDWFYVRRFDYDTDTVDDMATVGSESSVTSDVSTPGCSAVYNGNFISLTTTAADATYERNNLSISGFDAYKVFVRIKQEVGKGWSGKLRYSTAGHGFSDSYYKSQPLAPSADWGVLEWDMSDLDAGGGDWITSTITGLELELSPSAGDVFQIDYIKVYDPTYDDMDYYTSSFSEAYKHVNRSIGVSTGTYGLKARRSNLETAKKIAEVNKQLFDNVNGVYTNYGS